jgi:nitroreductase
MGEEKKELNFLELARKRSSCRKYLQKEVSDENVEIILESARIAPSACNKQPWRFVVVKNPEIKRKLIKEGCLFGINMDWAINASVIIVVGLKKSLITHKIAPQISKIDYSLIDIGIAGEHIVLQATELGLGSCWIGWIKPEEVRKIVNWEKEIQPKALITLGYPAEPLEKEKLRFSLKEIAKFIK